MTPRAINTLTPSLIPSCRGIESTLWLAFIVRVDISCSTMVTNVDASVIFFAFVVVIFIVVVFLLLTGDVVMRVDGGSVTAIKSKYLS